MISVRVSRMLQHHLRTFQVDDATVDEVLFEGGRLSYPGRKDIELELGYPEPYTLEHEARVIEGLPLKVTGAIRFLAAVATDAYSGHDLTLDLLWGSHNGYLNRSEGPSLDRLVAALVTVERMKEVRLSDSPLLGQAASSIIGCFERFGLPLTREGLEEIFDGAEPACVGLGLVEL